MCAADTLFDHLRQARVLADSLAPFYWFAPDETYFPINPFLRAFDGRDNDGDGALDFEDPDELVWPDLLHLDSAFLNARRLAHPGEPTRDMWRRWGAVFYRVRPLNDRQRDEILYYLQSDEQSWSRFRRLATLEPEGSVDWIDELESTDFISVEFYGYFVRDLGLQGHDWDMELAQMIFPEARGLRDKLSIHVGAGHTQDVPNNIRVLHNLESPPSSDRLHLLVELWDHSNATDFEPYGVFNFTPDVNWHARKSWGLRDTQARFGTAATGEWDDWMAAARVPARTVVYVPPTATDAEIQPYRRVRARIEGEDYWYPEQAEYSLLSATAFECLFGEFVKEQPDVRKVDALVDAIVAEHVVDDSGPAKAFGRLTPDVRDAVLAAFRRLSAEGIPLGGDKKGDVSPSQMLAWRSPHYVERPTRTLKTHLFRPVWGAQERFSHWASLFKPTVVGYVSNAFMWQVSGEVPAFNWPLHVPGLLELQGGVLCAQLNCSGGEQSLAISLQHTGDYRAIATWYARVSWVPRLEEVMPGRADLGDVLVGGGLSLRLLGQRLRLGIATDARTAGPRFPNTWWEVMVSPFQVRLRR